MTRAWLITGASRGIGRAVTEAALARGDRVAAVARRIDALAALHRVHGDRLQPVAFDMSDTAAIPGMVGQVLDRQGRVDIVLSNAGHALLAAAEEAEEAQVARMIATNLLAPIHLTRALLPHLRAQGGGRIIQMSSEAGQVTYPGASLYHAAKWGVEGFFESVAQEVAGLGLHVTIVEPGRVATTFDDSAELPAQTLPDYQRTSVGIYRRLLAMGRFPNIGDPLKVAAAIIACADREKPPRRLVLGSDAFRNIRRALVARLAELDAQEDGSARTDAT